MFSYERRRETNPAFKDGMCDLRNGCCGCFIPYFPYRQFLEQVETSEKLFDLFQILLCTHTRCEALVHMSQAAALPERNIFALTPSVVLETCWQLIGWTRWLSCLSPGLIHFCYIKVPRCTSISGLSFAPFPASISTFQLHIVSLVALRNLKDRYAVQQAGARRKTIWYSTFNLIWSSKLAKLLKPY